MREYTKKEWIEIIHKSIMDELSDAAYYHRLATIAPDYEARHIILSIAADEERHAKELMEMHASICGCSHYKNPAMPNPSVADYKNALVYRFHEELNAYKKYKEYYLCSGNMRMRDMWFDIMHDENRHAMYMMYLMHKYCCSMMEHHLEEHKHEHECPDYDPPKPYPGCPGCGSPYSVNEYDYGKADEEKGATTYFSSEIVVK